MWFYQQYNTTNSRKGGKGALATRGAVTPWQTDKGAPALSQTHAAYVLSSFISAVKANTLPQVSWIVAPAGYCEHPSYTPDYGAHYVNTVLQTLMSNPELWKNTALFITYDEHDGFFDHQLPPFAEPTVTDEYIDGLPIGPGSRVPMLICSPWTRGGYVDSNVYNHTSMLQFLAAWTGVKPANVTPWRASVTGDLTAAFDFEHPDFSIPASIPTLEQTWALTQLTGGSTTPPAEGDQQMPAQEPGTRPHRPTLHQPFADVTVDRDTSQVTARLTNTGRVGVSFAVYPDALLPATPTPVTVLPSSRGSYVWDATLTAGKYAFSVYGPDGFLTSFAGEVAPAGQRAGQIPVVTAAPHRGPTRKVELTLTNEGEQAIVYTLTPNEYEGSTRTGHRAVQQRHHRQLAQRLLRCDHHRQHRRRLPPPLRGPARLTEDGNEGLLNRPVTDNDGVIELLARMAALLESLQASRRPAPLFPRDVPADHDRDSPTGSPAAASTIPDKVERWDVAFAGLYLDALEAALAGRRPPGPWEVAFGAPAELPPVRHVLLGMNAHINYDLPQALLAVITDGEFADPALLAQQVHFTGPSMRCSPPASAPEGDELASISGPSSSLDRLLAPLSRQATRRFLREPRQKVWANAVALSEARARGPEAYASARDQLAELSAAKVTTLQAPGQILLKLAVTGFGVRLKQ